MKAIVSIESSNVSPLTACDNTKSNKNPSRKGKKRKQDSKKNHSFDVQMHDLVIHGYHFVIVFSQSAFLTGKLYCKGGASS